MTYLLNPFKSAKIFLQINQNPIVQDFQDYVSFVLYYDIHGYLAYPIVQDFSEKSKSMLIHSYPWYLWATIDGCP